MKKINVCTKGLDEKAPLFYRYPKQINPQPARIELDSRDHDVHVYWIDEHFEGLIEQLKENEEEQE